MALKFLKKASIQGKTVFVRLDINEPIGEDGKVADDFRIQAALPTIRFLQSQGCKIILTAHLGRPDGKVVQALSLLPVAERLAELLRYKITIDPKNNPEYPPNRVVFLTGDIRKKMTQDVVRDIASPHIVLLENIRFYKEEEENDAAFAKMLAGLADVYVNEAFSVCHHAGASVTGVPKIIPGYVGLQLEQEILALDRVLTRPKKPFVAMVAGIKISDKEKTLKNLGKTADYILTGGGIANVFFLAKGYELGLSKVEAESVKLAWQLEKNFKTKLLLPDDVVVANKQIDKQSIRVCAPHEVKKSELILDIGPKTILKYAGVLKKAKTIVWNGPMGKFEQKPFHHGTMSLARIVGSVGKRHCFTVVGGGETVDAIRLSHQAQFIDHLSTGGGAMLEYLAGDTLPGIEVLK